MNFGKKAAHGGAKRSIVLVVSVLVLLLAVAGGTLAWLTANTGPVVNTFTPAHVTCQVDETFDGTTKSDVKVKNAGDIPAYIRAYIIVTWKDSDGNVYGQLPVANADYTMEMAQNTGWVTGSDGYYYYTDAVDSKGKTGVLIKSCTEITGKAPVGCNLSVEIMAEAIQSVPDKAVHEAWPVVTANSGKLTVTTGN